MEHVVGYTKHVPSKPGNLTISRFEYGEVRPLGYSPRAKHSAISMLSCLVKVGIRL